MKLLPIVLAGLALAGCSQMSSLSQSTDAITNAFHTGTSAANTAGAVTEGSEPDTPADRMAIKTRLEQRFAPAKTTPDGSAIDVAGAVLELQKAGLVMNKLDVRKANPNVYKDGEIKADGFFGALGKLGTIGTGDGNAPSSRTFAVGEKFWVTRISVHKDGVVFRLMSDPINDVSYHATLRFPIPEDGPVPTPEQALAAASEVFKTDAPDAGAPPPPPPVAEAPKTITIGMDRDDVIAAFGQPTRVVKMGAKEIYYYPDIKVTFVKEKVSDVQ